MNEEFNIEDREFWQRWAEWTLDQPDAPANMRSMAEHMLDTLATVDALEADAKRLGMQ